MARVARRTHVDGRTLDDVKGAILTHGDSDHVGFAERLRRDHGVPVYVHASDAGRAKGGPKPANAKQPMRLGPLLGFMAYALRKGGMRTGWLTEIVEVHDGETLDLPGAPQIIGLPGHSAGSIAIYVPVADAVFVGDGLTTRHMLTGKNGPSPRRSPTNRIRQSHRCEPSWAQARSGCCRALELRGAPWSSGVEAAVVAVETAPRTAK